MNRRKFISFIATSAATWPRNARAQQGSKKAWHVGVVHTKDNEIDRRDRALEEHLAKLNRSWEGGLACDAAFSLFEGQLPHSEPARGRRTVPEKPLRPSWQQRPNGL
jgi:hypothetical protein